MHPFIHPRIHLATTHCLLHSNIYLLLHPSIHPLSHLSTCLFIHQSTHPLTHSLVHSSPIHPFLHPSAHPSFLQPPHQSIHHPAFTDYLPCAGLSTGPGTENYFLLNILHTCSVHFQGEVGGSMWCRKGRQVRAQVQTGVNGNLMEAQQLGLCDGLR